MLSALVILSFVSMALILIKLWEAQIRELRAKGDGILKIGRTLGVGTSVVVQRVVAETVSP
jgi:hypothetical protein